MRRHHYLQVSMIGAGDYYRYHTLNYLLVASPEESCAAGAGGDEGKDEFYRYPLSENETKTQFPLFRVFVLSNLHFQDFNSSKYLFTLHFKFS